jgi:AraC-like DNA-binding protein
MNAIDKAVEHLKSLSEGKHFTYQKVADQFGCSRSALSRRWRSVSRDKATGYGDQQALPPHQELELIQYIVELHKMDLSPTREMTRNLGQRWLEGSSQ